MSPCHLVILSLLLLGLAVRLLAIRDVVFPLWVDASRHGVITAVMRDSGQVITSYAPYLPVERFPYHYGFHAIAASLALLGGWPLARLLLVLGQLLNALVPLSVYASVWLVTRRRETAVWALFLVALPSFFPAYYATWGRFTQLTGMVLLPLLLALTWQVGQGARGWRRAWWLVALLATGLFYVHFRVFLLYVPFAVIVWLLGRNGRWLLAAGGATAVLTAPRAWELWQQTRQLLTSSGTAIAGYNSFPLAYYNSGWDRYLVWAAAALLPLALLPLFQWRRRGRLPIVLLIWTAVLLILVGGGAFGFSRLAVLNLSSTYIVLFVPLALYLALALGLLRGWVQQWPLWLQAPVWGVGGMVAALLLLFGVHQQIGILNPQTVLARQADVAGMEWVASHTPADATIAVNSWLWLGNTWAGADGGAWLVPLTGRRSSTPPADYIYDRTLFQQVNGFNETAVAIDDWAAPETAVWLQNEGVSHLFVGAKGGFLDPATLQQNPGLTLVYSYDGVFVFAVDGTP